MSRSCSGISVKANSETTTQHKSTCALDLISLAWKAYMSFLHSSLWSVHMMPFSKCAGRTSVFITSCLLSMLVQHVPFSCEWEAYLLHFPPRSKCASIVQTQPD